jgi:hypothetical protein
MPFGLIFIQYASDHFSQIPVDARQSFGHIFVYGAFADAEYFCCLSYSIGGLQYVIGDLDRTLSYIVLHLFPPFLN